MRTRFVPEHRNLVLDAGPVQNGFSSQTLAEGIVLVDLHDDPDVLDERHRVLQGSRWIFPIGGQVVEVEHDGLEPPDLLRGEVGMADVLLKTLPLLLSA